MSEFVPGFDAALPGDGRTEAFAEYAVMPMPKKTDEEWRRTDPSVFPFSVCRRAPDLRLASNGAGEEWADEFDVVVSVRDGEFSIRDVSGALKASKARVAPLGPADGGAIPDRLAPLRTKFSLLNAAFWNFGLLIHVPKGVRLPRGICMHYRAGASGSILLPRVRVMAEELSEFTLVEHFESPDDAALVSVGVRETHLGPAANVRLVSLQEWGGNTHHISNEWTWLDRDARIDWLSLNFGARVSKVRLGGEIGGPGASAEMGGLYFGSGEQHYDQSTVQVHSAPHTQSNLLYKGAVMDRAYSIYRGMIEAKPGAQKIDAYQNNNNLVLSDGARADSIPGLEIEADDLRCTHGATVGHLDPEQLFYLRSRGLDETGARQMIISGFFEQIIHRLPYGFLQERVRRKVEEKMGGLGGR